MKKFIFILLLILSFWTINLPSYANNSNQIALLPSSNALTNAINNNAAFRQSPPDITVNAFFQNKSILLIWDIPDEMKLYRDRIAIKLIDNENVKLGKIHFPKAQIWQDPILGPQPVYTHQLSLKIPVYSKDHLSPYGSQLQIIYQACFKDQCLPFKKVTFTLKNQKAFPLNKNEKATSYDDKTPDRIGFRFLLSLLGLGILLSFTPCVLPMLPIISGIVLGQDNTNKLKGFLLSLSYVLGMALTYTVLGIIIALIGASFQSLFQTPVVIIVTALLFVLMALSMFDLFQIQLPQKAQHFIYKLQEKPKPGSIFSAFIFGIIASLIVSPCTSAPLISVLSLIAQSGNWLTGGLALFILAIGMGIPLILVGTGLGYFLPKAGTWMNDLKYLMGVVMLIMAIWLLGRILPPSIALILYAIVFLSYAVFLGAFEISKTKFDKIKRAFGLVLFLYSVSLFIGGMMGNSSLLKPLSFNNMHNINNKVKRDYANHIIVTNQAELTKALQNAKLNHQQIVLDFYASWCHECQIIGALLTSDAIKQQLQDANVILIQVNASKYSDQMNQILKKYQIIGFPTLIFLDKNMKEIRRHSGILSIKQLNHFIKD